MPNLHKLITTFARAEEALRGQEFVAPLLRGGRARLRVRGLVCELAVAGARPGWWRCRMRDAHHAETVDEAMPWQRGDYLALWQALRLVLLHPLGEHGDWAALPLNPSDAWQRFGMRGPLVARLVENGQPFERVIARVEGRTLWYDDQDRRADPAIAESLRAALHAEQAAPNVANLSPGEQAAYALLARQHMRDHTEQRLIDALAIGGARLVGYEAADGGLRVTWARGTERNVALVSTSMDVVSAGICLSGQDERFDLASIIGVVADAPQFARWYDE
jgi:hypothetical protein